MNLKIIEADMQELADIVKGLEEKKYKVIIHGFDMNIERSDDE